MKIKYRTYKEVMAHCTSAPPERGGILGMKDGLVSDYIHDNARPILNRAIYAPDIKFLNKCIEEWAEKGIEFCGIVHSHPNGQDTLSSGDMEYIKVLYEVNPQIKNSYFPLVLNGREFKVYSVERNGEGISVKPDLLEIIE